MTLENENGAKWTIELYKRSLKGKGINTGQNGVRIIVSGWWTVYGWISEPCTCIYPHAAIACITVLHVETKPFIMFPDSKRIN